MSIPCHRLSEFSISEIRNRGNSFAEELRTEPFTDHISYIIIKAGIISDVRRIAMLAAKVTSKGQVTIPRQVRKKLNIVRGDIVEFAISGDKVEIARLGNIESFYGSIKVKGAQDFGSIRKLVKKRVAQEAAHEGA
jgi:antitoxin PrlF